MLLLYFHNSSIQGQVNYFIPWKFVIVGKPFARDLEHHATMLQEQKQRLTYEQIEARHMQI